MFEQGKPSIETHSISRLRGTAKIPLFVLNILDKLNSSYGS